MQRLDPNGMKRSAPLELDVLGHSDARESAREPSHLSRNESHRHIIVNRAAIEFQVDAVDAQRQRRRIGGDG